MADRLIADGVAQMSQGTSQTVIAPAPIFFGHLHDQIFQCFLNTGTSRRLALAGAIAFVSGEFPLPGKDGLRLNNMGHFFQGFLAQFLADLSESLALGITELDSPLDLVAQDTVFSREKLVSE